MLKVNSINLPNNPLSNSIRSAKTILQEKLKNCLLKKPSLKKSSKSVCQKKTSAKKIGDPLRAIWGCSAPPPFIRYALHPINRPSAYGFFPLSPARCLIRDQEIIVNMSTGSTGNSQNYLEIAQNSQNEPKIARIT